MPGSWVSGVIGDDGRELLGLGGPDPVSENGLDYMSRDTIVGQWCIQFSLANSRHCYK